MGFSRYVNEAVVYVEFYGGPLGFDGSLYVLQRDLQGWKVVDIITIFVT